MNAEWFTTKIGEKPTINQKTLDFSQTYTISIERTEISIEVCTGK